MIHFIELAEVVGLFEVTKILSCVSDHRVVSDISDEYPILQVTVNSLEERINDVCRKIIEENKRNVLLLTPEIALLEYFACLSPPLNINFLLSIPAEWSSEKQNRTLGNIPRGVRVERLDEPYFPPRFLPNNSLILATGFQNNDRVILLPQVYRLATHYSSFCGKKLFIPINEENDVLIRPSSNWTECYEEVLFNEKYN